jgi:hypothetical protein
MGCQVLVVFASGSCKGVYWQAMVSFAEWKSSYLFLCNMDEVGCSVCVLHLSRLELYLGMLCSAYFL